MFPLLKIILGLIVVFFLVHILRTWQLEHSANQKLFASGTIPNPLPDGLYNGSVSGHTFSWLGKKFFATTSRGINIFTPLDIKLSNGVNQNSTTTEKYPFKTSLGKGLRDKTLDVFQIDYNIPANPFWLRPILDEIVEITPGHYLGKLQARFIPGFPFTLSYFELKK